MFVLEFSFHDRFRKLILETMLISSFPLVLRKQLACRTFLPRRVMARGGIQLGWETTSETFQHVTDWVKFNPGQRLSSVKDIT